MTEVPNTNNQNQTQQEGNAISEDIKSAKSLVSRISSFLANLKNSDFKSLMSKIFGKYKIVILASASFLGILITLGLLLAFVANRDRSVPIPTEPPATPSPTPSEEIRNPSRYATDSGVLKIQTDIEAIDGDLNSVDLKENFLKPPVIRFDVKF